MFFERKTKDSSILKVILIPIGVIALFFTVASLAGFGPAFYMLGVIYLFLSVMPFITFWRTRNAGFLAVTLFLIFAFLVCVSAPPAIT